MAAFDSLKRMFEIQPNDYVFKFGPRAHDLEYDEFNNENISLKEWTSAVFKDVKSIKRLGQ